MARFSPLLLVLTFFSLVTLATSCATPDAGSVFDQKKALATAVKELAKSVDRTGDPVLESIEKFEALTKGGSGGPLEAEIQAFNTSIDVVAKNTRATVTDPMKKVTSAWKSVASSQKKINSRVKKTNPELAAKGESSLSSQTALFDELKLSVTPLEDQMKAAEAALRQKVDYILVDPSPAGLRALSGDAKGLRDILRETNGMVDEIQKRAKAFGKAY